MKDHIYCIIKRPLENLQHEPDGSKSRGLFTKPKVLYLKDLNTFTYLPISFKYLYSFLQFVLCREIFRFKEPEETIGPLGQMERPGMGKPHMLT